MKFNINKMLLALAVCALGVSCNKEKLSEIQPSGQTVKVNVSIAADSDTKSFSDAEGIKWEVGDQIKYAGGVKLTSEALKAEDISEDGYRASFTFDAKLTEVDRTGWFCSTKCHPDNYTEVAFTLGADNGNVLVQNAAGEMNSRYVFLHSGTGLVNITKDETPEITMEIAGSVFRVIPYTGTYNDEKILSVTFSSDSDVVGTVAYDRAGNSYRGVSEVGFKNYKSVRVNLGTAFPLEGVTDKEHSKGIYFAVAATKEGSPLNGYSYRVETDKADYVFSSPAELVVSDNVLKNIPLNLDKAERIQPEGGLLRYDGALMLSTIPVDGCSNLDAGYWQALTSTDEGQTWTAMLNSENSAFYNGVVFDYKDSEGNDVSWLTVNYGGGDMCHWIVNAEANTGDARSVIVTAHFSDVKSYAIQEGSLTKEWTFTQPAVGTAKKVGYASVSLQNEIEIEGAAITDKNVGYCLLNVEGTDNRDWSKTGIYARSRFVAVSEEDYQANNFATPVDWLDCRYPDNGTDITDCVWLVSAKENGAVSSRTAYIVCLFPEDGAYEFPEPRALKVTQKANLNIAASFSEVYSETVSNEGATISAGKLALAINGESQADVAAAISAYHMNLSANKSAAVSVDAVGVVTLVVPQNRYNNGGVTYTVTLRKDDGSILAQMNISQATGTEEGTSVCEYTYDLEIVNKAFGYPANQTDNGANWGYIRNVKKDGVTVELTQEIADEVLEFAWRGVEPTEEEKTAVNQSSKTSSATAVTPRVRWFGGVQIDVALDSGASGQITKIVGYNPDGTEFGSFIVWID